MQQKKVTGGETLMKMITELKHSILVNDFETINENVEKMTEHYKSQTSRMIPHIHTLNREITEALNELENEYYSSPYKLDPRLLKEGEATVSSSSAALSQLC